MDMTEIMNDILMDAYFRGLKDAGMNEERVQKLKNMYLIQKAQKIANEPHESAPKE